MRKGLVAAAAALLLGAGASAVVLLPDGEQRTATPATSPTPSPEPSRSPLLAAVSAEAPRPSAAGVRRVLAPLLRAPALGGLPSIVVVDAATGEELVREGGDRPAVPASTTKILTAVAALTVLDPDARLTTKVVRGPAPGDVVLVGGGDPTLAGAFPPEAVPRPARLADLATALKGAGARRVLVDDSLFTGPRTGPGWKPGYVTDGDVAPVSALEVDGGRLSDEDGAPRATDPALSAGRQLARLLGVRAAVVRGAAPKDAEVLAQVQSPPVADLVERMLTRSDNDLAEALGRHVALARDLPASFAGEAQALSTVLAEVPGAPAVQDASGLSPLSRVRPSTLTALLVRAVQQDRLASVLSGLPVGGFDGTLSKRYRTGTSAVAAGQVRAKTGTLTGTSALAGLVRTDDGRLLAFAVLADRVPAGGTLGAQAALDALAAALARCGCP